MAYGFATHLWVLGKPSPSQIREWLKSAVPDVHEGDVEVWQLGERVVLGAVNTSDREWRWRSIGVVHATRPAVQGFEWVSVDVHPDHNSWRVERSSGEVFEWDSEEADDGQDEPSPESIRGAKEILRSLVPLKLEQLHHYVDWAHELEEVGDGGLAPELNVASHRLALELPPAPAPAAAVRVAEKAVPRLAKYWLSIASVAATAFTVSMVQAPGPGAFTIRLNHFLIQGASLWLLGTVLAGVTSNGWPGVRITGWSTVVVVVSGLVWAALPI